MHSHAVKTSIGFKELSPLPLMADHNGYDCKTYALSAALQWLFKAGLIKQEPLPPRKRVNAESATSLRHLLKHRLGSAAGESHNVIDLANLAEFHPEVAAFYGECKDEEQYSLSIMRSLDQGRPVVVFFDVSTAKENGQQGQPALLKGEFEHGAIVGGYGFNEANELFFKLSQWDTYFEVPAKKLFASSDQLPQERPQAENYFKIRAYRDNEGQWLPESFILQHHLEDHVIQRRKETHSAKGRGLHNKILILDSKSKPALDLSTMPCTLKRASGPVTALNYRTPDEDTRESEPAANARDKAWDRRIERNKNRIQYENLKFINERRPLSYAPAAAEAKEPSQSNEWKKVIATLPASLGSASASWFNSDQHLRLFPFGQYQTSGTFHPAAKLKIR